MSAKESDAIRKQREDRLSSLPDDILIDILSRIPLQIAISTDFLSRRWRGLWKEVTSIDIIRQNPEYLTDFDAYFDALMMQITSPFIHKFSLEFRNLVPKQYKDGYQFNWLRQICDRNVREIKIIWPQPPEYRYYDNLRVQWPSFIFQTQSLVSMDLDSSSADWLSPQNDDTIDLPNLKKLNVNFRTGFLEKLIGACPSLEEFCLNCTIVPCLTIDPCLTFSNKNLRRLSMIFDCQTEVLIIAPKLEYLLVHAPKSASFSFDEDPVELREADIQITSCGNLPWKAYKAISNEESNLPWKAYNSISNVRILTLDVFAFTSGSTRFRNATRVTLNMKTSHNIQIVLSLAKLCPVLHVLSLKFSDMCCNDEEHCVPPKCGHSNALRRGIKRIEIETYWKDHQIPTNSFLELVEHLLSKNVGMERFHFTIADDKDFEKGNSNRKIRMEEKLCKLLYQCPMVSVDSEVEFIGQFLKMSRRAGPNVWRANGKVTSFRCSPWNGFNF